MPTEAGDASPERFFPSSMATHTQAFIGALCCRSPPRTVIEERKTFFTVDPEGVVFAVADQLPKLILHALARMPITFASG